jgi:predicted dehydrogenase
VSETIRIGIIGSGAISRFIHIPGFLLCPDVEVAVACDASLEAAQESAKAFGISRTTTDYHEVIDDDAIDGVVVATPNHLHRPISLEAMAHGKHVLCEKPVALNATGAGDLVKAAEQADVVNMVSFVYRFVPAMRYLKHLISEGYLGEIRHLRAQYLQLVPEIWLGWRSEKRFAGSGTLGDIGSHLIDFARYLVGEIASVSSWCKTFLHQRPVPGTGELLDADVDDASGFLAEFAGGATGVFEVSRLVPGRDCGRGEYQYLEVNGTKGTGVFYLQDPFHLQLCLRGPLDDMSLVRVPVPEQMLKAPGSPRDIRADAPNVGFRYDQAFTFVEAIRGRDVAYPDFSDGLRAQQVVDAVLYADATRRWVDVQ